nr:reverse transcriptase domain-containing protein [Tanacetum cinerariifolium]
MATKGNGDPSVPDLQTMEELCQTSLNGRGGPIAPIAIQAMNFGLKNDMIQQVQNSCQFHGLSGDDANKHLDKFLHVTQSIKVNGVTNDAIRQYHFSHSLTYHATAWFDRLPRNSINTYEQMEKIFLGKYFPSSMVTKLRNEIINFRQRPDESLFEAWERYKLSNDRYPNHNMLPVTQIDTFYNGLTLRHRDLINAVAAQRSESSSSTTSSSDSKIVALKVEMAEINENLMRVLQVNQQVKAVTPTCETCGGPHSYNDCPATVGQTQNVYAAGAYQCGNSYQPQGGFEGYHHSGNAYQGPTIPTTSSSLPQIVEHETEVTKDSVHLTNNESTKDVQPLVVQVETPNLNSEPVVAPILEPVVAPVSASKPNQKPSIPFADALILMPKFGPTIKTLLTNKDKPSELAKTQLNEHCSVVLLKKLPEKLRDPDKFLISCDFLRMDECLPLADLGASINLMPLSVWNKLSFPELSPTCMTLELADRSIYRPIERALIDVFEGELTTFNLDQTSRYSANYIDMMANRIDVIDKDCEEYSQEVLGFSDVIVSGNPTAYYDPIVSTYSPTLTPFGDRDILLLEAFLKNDPSLPPPTQGKYLPQVKKELQICESKNDKSSIDEPLEVELKDLPPHLKYAFLEGDDKFPIIIAKDLKDEEKTAVIKVLKSHRRAIAWKLSDIKGWRVYIDYQKLNEATRKDHFPLLFMDQMLERLARNETFAYRRMPFGLCNAPGTFQRCMMAIFHDMIENTMEVFMDDVSIFGNSFRTCLSHLEKMLKRCEDTNHCLNWEKSHFMVKKGIVLGHKISKNGMEVDKAKVDVIAKLPHPTTVKAWPITHLLEKDTPLSILKECVEAFQTLKRKLTEAPILISPDWDLPFELMCDASDLAIGVVLGQHHEKHFRPIHYASKTMTEAKLYYTMTEKEMLAVVYAFEKLRSYLIMNKGIMYTDHSALKYLFAKKIQRRGCSGGFYSFKSSNSNLRDFRCLGHRFHGSFPSSRGNKYILMAVDYLSKWVEAKALPTNDARVVCKVLKSPFARFGTPCAIISDRSTHFCNYQFVKVMLKYGVTHRLATAYHPQTSGQVEVSNRGLKIIMERTVGENRASWSD